MTTKCKTMIMQVQTCHITLLTFAYIFFGNMELQLQLYEGYYGMCVYELCYWVASNFTLNLVKTT